MLKLLKVNCECPQQPNSGLGDLNADDSSCRPEFGMEGESEDTLTFFTNICVCLERFRDPSVLVKQLPISLVVL